MTTYELRDSKQAAESFQLSPSRTVYLSICHMFVADGLKFVLLVTVRFAPGTIIYVWARGAERASVHPRRACDLCCRTHRGAIGIYGLMTGHITP